MVIVIEIVKHENNELNETEISSFKDIETMVKYFSETPEESESVDPDSVIGLSAVHNNELVDVITKHVKFAITN